MGISASASSSGHVQRQYGHVVVQQPLQSSAHRAHRTRLQEATSQRMIPSAAAQIEHMRVLVHAGLVRGGIAVHGEGDVDWAVPDELATSTKSPLPSSTPDCSCLKGDRRRIGCAGCTRRVTGKTA